MFIPGFPFRKAGEPRPVTAKEVSEDRWHLSDVVLPLPLPGKPVPESGGRLLMEASKFTDGIPLHPQVRYDEGKERYGKMVKEGERCKAWDASVTVVL